MGCVRTLDVGLYHLRDDESLVRTFCGAVNSEECADRRGNTEECTDGRGSNNYTAAGLMRLNHDVGDTTLQMDVHEETTDDTNGEQHKDGATEMVIMEVI